MGESEDGPRSGGERRMGLLLQYDGLPFHGWQVQPARPTVQEALEGAIARVTGEAVRLTGSGRTDAGVHALGQVASFATSSRLPERDFARALNSLVPPSIAVLSARELPLSFDARRSAVGKVYLYRILLSRCRSPLELGRLWQVPYRLDLHRMREASTAIRGRRDFSSFRAAGCASRSAVRDLRRLRLRRRGNLLEIELEADGFLRHMVRNIVGTLVDVGRGRIGPKSLPAIVDSRDRCSAGTTAPPYGLYLVEVHYLPAIEW